MAAERNKTGAVPPTTRPICDASIIFPGPYASHLHADAVRCHETMRALASAGLKTNPLLQQC
eukprot:6193129-Pleurochrysis_carterae.AAC.3